MQNKPAFSKQVPFLVLTLFFMSLSPAANQATDIFPARQQIESLIEAGNLTDAQAQIERLKADYSQDPCLPGELYWIGRRYEWSTRYDEAKNISQQITQNYTDSPYAARARMSLARENILSLIISGEYDQAQEALSKLLNDFAGDSDLPDALYWIAERYRWADKREKAKHLYQQIIQNYPGEPEAVKAKLGLAREEIMSLIISHDYSLAEEKIKKLVTDFPADTDLPDALYWIAERYRWEHKWEQANGLYRQIIQNHPGSTFASRASLGMARAEVLPLLVAKNYGNAEKALNKLVADFQGHQDLPETLYWIAEGYRWGDKYEKAKIINQQIVQNYPDSWPADKARQMLQTVSKGLDIFSLIESGRVQAAEVAIDDLIKNFNESEPAAYTVFLCGDRYYAKGLQKKNAGLEAEAVEDFTRAVDIWDKIIRQLPGSVSTAHAYYRSANCCVDLRQYDRAVERYTRLVEDFPDYYLAWDAYFKIGRYLQKLKDTGAIDGTSADTHTKAAYKLILEKYPDCPAARAAGNWLKKHAG